MSKKRNRQPSVNEELSEGSTDFCDVCNCANTIANICSHISKAVNFNKVKKHIKKVGISTECPVCKKCKDNDKEHEIKSATLICLLCGHQGCGKVDYGHALVHYKKAHSDPHFLVVDNDEWNVWCFSCQTKVNIRSGKKLYQTVEFIKRCTIAKNSSQTEMTQTQSDEEIIDIDKKETEKVVYNFPKVGGLINLGNTCFFNAVLQCLAQTPFLVKVLDDLRLPGQKFILLGGKHKLANSSEEVDLPPIEGTLENWGSFTSILWKTLTEMQNSDGHQSYRPSELLNEFKKKTMQCMDGGQHDSHELLRHLLEIVRNEDLKRYQSIILKEFGLNEKTNPEGVEESLKSRVKFYGNQANARLLGTELVFRGVLVSTLKCLDCHHSSQSTEPFLDLSLPVMADKPQPLVLKRKNNGFEDIFDVTGNNMSYTPSKYQLKKEKKAARKNRKNKKQEMFNHGHSFVSSKNDVGDVLESEESDADVEDNVEVEGILPTTDSSVTSKESPTNPSPTLTNDKVLEDIQFLSMLESINHDKHEWNQRKIRRKKEVCLNEISNGIDNITSGISKIGIDGSLQQSPTRYPMKEGECSILSCLNQFTALELMSGSNKVSCEACTAKEKKVRENYKMICTPSTKQYLISRVPAVLILHLKRMQAQRVDFRKVTRHVSFPILLDLAPICKNHKKPRIYALYGVVEHSGTIHGGHYVAYVKSRLPLTSDDPRWSFLPSKDIKDTQESPYSSSSDSDGEETVEPPPGKWYHISDSRVMEVDETTVLQSQAYLLFYERIL